MREIGLTPVEALRAATSVAARVLGLADQGVIAKGQRAPVMLVEGDPNVDCRRLEKAGELKTYVDFGSYGIECSRICAAGPKRAVFFGPPIGIGKLRSAVTKMRHLATRVSKVTQD